MRVLLVGPPADRTRVRSDLAGSDMEIVGEFPTITAARRSRLHADAIVMTPAVDDSGAMLGERATLGDETGAEPLTAREHQVLDLLAEGLPNKGIAGRLGISDQTVKFHVASICGKLRAANRTEAVRRAVRRGLITL